MSRASRKSLIQQIESMRGSRVLAYVTSDRPPAPGQIGDDVVRPLFHHLRKMDSPEKIDLFLYSRGGAIDVPWRINTAIRATAKNWHALVPFRANSAATLLCLGADEIVLGRHGELGPIDPIMNIRRVVSAPGSGESAVVQDAVSVEDIMTYLKFIQERAGLSDQATLATGLSKLTDRMDAVALGSAYRTFSHIRDVARRMLQSQNQPPSEQTIATIVESLAEKVYAHGHAIGVRTAKEIGVPAIEADATLDNLMWQLLEEYEADLKLRDPIDPVVAVSNADEFVEDATIAILEDAETLQEFKGELRVKTKRQIPSTLNVSLNINIQLPPALATTLASGAAPAANQLQQLVQQAQQAALQQAQLAVQDALKQQAPITGLDVALLGGRWQLVEG